MNGAVSPFNFLDFIFLLYMKTNRTTSCSVGRRTAQSGQFSSSADGPTAQGAQLIPDGDRICVPEWVVGKLAEDRPARFPRRTFYDTKRVLGCSYDICANQEAMKHMPWPVICGPNGEILIEIAEANGIRRYHPWELAAKILRKLKNVAEPSLGESAADLPECHESSELVHK
jgi:molecular chaperone DnaK (HSP70)